MFGTTKTCPWTLSEEDEKYVAVTQGGWEQAYPEIDNTIDIIQSAADFYLLFGMVTGGMIDYEPLRLPPRQEVLSAAMKLGLSLADVENRDFDTQLIVANDPRKQLTLLADAAQVKFDELIARLDTTFIWYLHLACGGELRHHNAVGGKVLSKTRHVAWVGWRKVFDAYGVDALLQMSKLFRETAKGGYGGPLWADGSDVLHARLTNNLGPDFTTNRFLFVDRVFTLEHNGGCFLNKISWGNNRTNATKGWGLGTMQTTVLKAHSAEVPDFNVLHSAASEEVQSYVTQYLALADEFNMRIKGKWKADTEPVELIEPEQSSEIVNETPWNVNDDIWGTEDEEEALEGPVKSPEANWTVSSEQLKFSYLPSPGVQAKVNVKLNTSGLAEAVAEKLNSNYTQNSNSIYNSVSLPGVEINPWVNYTIRFVCHSKGPSQHVYVKDYVLQGNKLLGKKFHWKMITKASDEKDELDAVSITITPHDGMNGPDLSLEMGPLLLPELGKVGPWVPEPPFVKLLGLDIAKMMSQKYQQKVSS